MLPGSAAWKRSREHEVDQGVRALEVLRAGEHAGELDLPEAAAQ